MANTYTLIASSTAGAGGVANIEFTSIPSTYTDLQILCSLDSSISAGADDIYIQFNGSASNFNWKNALGTGSSAISQNNTNNQAGSIPAANVTASAFGSASLYIPNYAGSNYKSISSDSVVENNGTTGYQALYATLWSNTAAITSIKLLPSSGTFLQYSTAYLYGIKNS
jgi:hypothetical protein